MRKGTVLNFRGFGKVIQFLKLNNLLIVLTSFFAVGLIFGVFALEKYDFLKVFTENTVSDYIGSRTDSGFLEIVLKSFLSSMLFIILTFSCGASLLGVILVPLCVSARGCLYGLIAALLYSEYSLKGIAFHAVIFLPPAIIFIVALILLSLESVRFSVVLTRLTLPQTVPTDLSFGFKNYCVKYLLFSLLVLFSAVVDALLSINFLESFSLS